MVTGRVTKLMDFGAFVELEPGVEGLVPISEMSFERRIKHPSEVVREGDMVQVRVLDMDLQRKRMSLSIKRTADDPWQGASVRWAPGSSVEGKVTRLADFGAFVELTPGVEGLVHISEMSNERVRSPGDVVKEGQSVKVNVIEVDEEKRRISLTMKETPEVTDWQAELEAAKQDDSKPKKKRKKPLKGGLDWGF
jgi:small subunit ribosomal protein S1